MLDPYCDKHLYLKLMHSLVKGDTTLIDNEKPGRKEK
jgi:hypothetical protein